MIIPVRNSYLNGLEFLLSALTELFEQAEESFDRDAHYNLAVNVGSRSEPPSLDGFQSLRVQTVTQTFGTLKSRKHALQWLLPRFLETLRLLNETTLYI